MKCAAMQKKKKAKMTREEREAWNLVSRRYTSLRMSMNHNEAMEQLRKEFSSKEETDGNDALHEIVES